MSLPCEVAVKCLLPPVRAALAEILKTKHHLTQMEAAKRLGVSQPAISLYVKKIRGKALNIKEDLEIMKIIEELADALARGDLAHKDYIQIFCEICKKIRSKGLLCQIHKNFEPILIDEGCKLCLDTNI
jgi:predicted transcriptional regulator